jgi:ribosome biogenesis GTPase
VAAVDRDLFLLLDRTGAFRARMAGAYLHRHRLPQELPCVGDWVCVGKGPAGGVGLIHGLLERRTALRRRSPGDAVGYQMIAANVDQVIVVQSCHQDFNLRRLERYLVMVRDGGAEPCILLTKTDLVGPEVPAALVAEIRAAGMAAPVLTLSNVTREGIAELQGMLRPGTTYCFVGSSGVGKSTIINRLVGRERLRTEEVSGTGEGRHTTVRRELVVLEGGALVVDNPGMREFGILGADLGLELGFPDIVGIAAGCRYRDCSHTGEPGCAVRAAVEAGSLDRGHYENFLKLQKESAFHRMTQVEKRKRDRDFGKFLKSVKKDLRRQ